MHPAAEQATSLLHEPDAPPPPPFRNVYGELFTQDFFDFQKIFALHGLM